MTRFGRPVAAGLACLALIGCGDDNENRPVVPTATLTASATPIPTATATQTLTFTPTPSPTFTPTPLPTFTFTLPPTPTSSTTPTTTATPTAGPLGTRHFVFSPNKSPFIGVLGEGLALTLGGFTGQTNGQPAPGFLDLEAGKPDPTTGVAGINITGASDFFYVTIAAANFTLCIKPIVPVMSAGLLDCKGTLDFSTVLTVDHNLGQVGLDGFTADQCDSMHGSIEGPNQICAVGLLGDPCRANADCDSTTGAGDGICGLGPATCTDPASTHGVTCRADADCDSMPGAGDGVCGQPGVHPGVCNGPFMASQAGGSSGPGALVIAPQSSIGLHGIPIELTFENALPCGDEGPGTHIDFALTTGLARGTILNFSNQPGQTVTFDAHGTNFSCTDWQNPSGPGKLVLTAPALHQAPGGGDIITVFEFGAQ